MVAAAEVVCSTTMSVATAHTVPSLPLYAVPSAQCPLTVWHCVHCRNVGSNSLKDLGVRFPAVLIDEATQVWSELCHLVHHPWALMTWP
jgi:hypothetical protein